MKIIVHGSVFTDNFGDVLFADLFYSRLKKSGNKVFFLENRKYGISDFVRKEIGYVEKCGIKDLFEADALVMLSGGYLGEDQFSKKNALIRYIKYIMPVRFLQMLGKKTYFIGVGGGPINSFLLRKSCVKALNNSEYISVRDQETYDYFVQYGVRRSMVVTSDTAQSISKEYCQKSHINLQSECFKYIFLHYVENENVDDIFANELVPALNDFLIEHQEYSVIIGTDVRVDEKRIRKSKTYNALLCPTKTVYIYCGIKQLCDVLSKVDFVITPKLHVGIVSATFGKSVISFPMHREKTQRYYKQIGETERSIKLSNLTKNIASSQIEKYYNIPIRLPGKIIQQAKSNLDFLSMFIEE